MKKSDRLANVYVAAMGAIGVGFLAFAAANWQSDDPLRFLFYALISALAARLKVHLPGITGTMSVTYLFILIGILELSYAETLVIGCLAGVMQCWWHSRNRAPIRQAVFAVGNMALAVAAAYNTFDILHRMAAVPGVAFPLAMAATAYFLANTLPIALIIALTEGKDPRVVWQECYFWSFPYYLVGAASAVVVNMVNRYAGWQAMLLVMPVVYWIYRSYRLYLERLHGEKKHAEDMAALHLRTIEALALAIDAKDQTTHDHLQRVQVYALAVAEEMGLSESEMEALRAAALLHDIGKLAVPEHIISKPGRLTPEEFEKMKIHPVVGAEILERVKFPYPVAPIVRSHHEKWNGAGYPDGLKGEAIPIGSRILSAVDCLDALASDRQYRKALPLDQAMAHVVADAGKAFDPRVVEILQRRYVELETKARATARVTESKKLSTDLKIEAGSAPAAGFATVETKDPRPSSPDFMAAIASACQEVQLLFELTKDLGSSLSVEETLSVFAVRLKRIVPYDAIAIYAQRGDTLYPIFVNGENARLFSSLEIPLGEGLSGWVAQNRMPMVNGNPSVEPGYMSGGARFSTLRAALAVPLDGPTDWSGVLAVYHRDPDAFSREHLRVLQAVTGKVAMAIENAVRYERAERSATTDALTGLPNARSLFLHLDSELSRCKRTASALTVLVCDLDGFKQLNDQYGHLEGNRVLQLVAQGLRDHCREYDYVARMGGDEFVLILPGAPGDFLSAKLDLLRRTAVDAAKHICATARLGLSIGHASYPEDGADAEQLLAEADRRMYAVKAQNKKHSDRHQNLRELGVAVATIQ